MCISCTAAFAIAQGNELFIIKSIDDAKALEGKEVGVSPWLVIDQARIEKFADATDDFQWIHVDQERAARELPDGKTIAFNSSTDDF